MGARYRRESGPSLKPAQVAAGTDGNLTAPRRLEFRVGGVAKGVSPAIIWNNTGGGRAIRIKLNSTTATDFGGGSDDGVGYFTITDGSAVEVSMGGILAVETISFVTTDSADDLDNVEVTGWTS